MNQESNYINTLLKLIFLLKYVCMCATCVQVLREAQQTH